MDLRIVETGTQPAVDPSASVARAQGLWPAKHAKGREKLDVQCATSPFEFSVFLSCCFACLAGVSEIKRRSPDGYPHLATKKRSAVASFQDAFNLGQIRALLWGWIPGVSLTLHYRADLLVNHWHSELEGGALPGTRLGPQSPSMPLDD